MVPWYSHYNIQEKHIKSHPSSYVCGLSGTDVDICFSYLCFIKEYIAHFELIYMYICSAIGSPVIDLTFFV